jgi:hypothetical protein
VAVRCDFEDGDDIGLDNVEDDRGCQLQEARQVVLGEQRLTEL